MPFRVFGFCDAHEPLIWDQLRSLLALSTHQVVTRHDTSRISHNSSEEGVKVDLTQGAVVNVGAGRSAVALLLIGNVMLDTGIRNA